MTHRKTSFQPMPKPQESGSPLSQGLALFKAGRHDEAERVLRKVLRASPTNADALQILGLLAAQKGNMDEAEQMLRRCVALAPKHAAAHVNLGNVLLTKQRFAEAALSYGRAVELAPQFAPAHYNHAKCLRAMGKLDAAMAGYRQALQLDPGLLEARINLGSALCEAEAYEEAEHLYRALLAQRPDLPEIKLYLGDVLRLRGQPEQARSFYESLLRDKPDHPRGRLLLGLALLDENAVEEAARWIGLAQEDARLPRHEVLSATAALRMRQGDQPGAIRDLAEAIKRGAHQPQSYLTLAIWLAETRQREQAIAVLEDSFSRYGDRPAGLLGQLVFNQRHLCDWRSWEERLPALIQRIRQTDRSILSPFAALSLSELTPADLLKVSRAFATRFQSWTARAAEPRQREAGQDRLRIGYLSADFHAHATAYLTASVFEHHDRERFEVFAYSWGPDDGSAMRQRLERAFEHFIDIGPLSFSEAAERIRGDGIDLLIDLKGYTRDARTEILAQRPCALQINWLGFPGSLGAPFIDYIVVDPVVVPEDQAAHYDEALAYLPNAYAPLDDRRQMAAVPTRQAAGLPEAGFVFCCFNNPYKITPEIFDRWCALLRCVPGSVLWLFASNDSAPKNLLQEAQARGISPERLIFAAKVPQEEHLARLALADLCLDTLPYNAHTTASDALWVGVPILTCPGETFASRVAASLLTAAGVPELIVRDLDEYEARARDLATHPEALATLRKRLRAAKETAPFFATERFTRDLEALYRRMWENHAQGGQPLLLPPRTL